MKNFLTFFTLLLALAPHDAYSSIMIHRKHKNFKPEKNISQNIIKPTDHKDPRLQLAIDVHLIGAESLHFIVPILSSATVLKLKEWVQDKAILSADEQNMSGVHNSVGFVTQEDIRDEMTIKEVCEKFNSHTFSIYQHLKSKKNK